MVAMAVVARYSASVSTTVLNSRLSIHPSLSKNKIIDAVEVDTPRGLLPQPWPPADTSTTAGLELTILTKMERVLSIVSGIAASSSEDLQVAIRRMFPNISLDAVPPGYKVFEFEAQLLEDGTVIHSFEIPADGEFPLQNCEVRPIESSLSSFLQGIVQLDMLRSIENFRRKTNA